MELCHLCVTLKSAYLISRVLNVMISLIDRSIHDSTAKRGFEPLLLQNLVLEQLGSLSRGLTGLLFPRFSPWVFTYFRWNRLEMRNSLQMFNRCVLSSQNTGTGLCCLETAIVGFFLSLLVTSTADSVNKNACTQRTC